jgi:hypothetical protein
MTNPLVIKPSVNRKPKTEDQSLEVTAGQGQPVRVNGQKQLNYEAITIVQCKSDRSLKTRYILTKRTY